MRSVGIWCGVPLAVAGLLVTLAAGDDQPVGSEKASADAAAARKARLFDDPEIFPQMSGAKRSALERQFGRRPVRGVAFTGEEFTDNVAHTFTNALAPLGNVLVNKPSADTTAQDTQSETAVLFGGGNNVVAAFNDSGSHVGGASKFTGWSLSTDGGVTFTDKGTLPASDDGDAGDPVLARSAKTKTIFLSTLAFNSGHKLMIFRSTDNGLTFQPAVNGAPGFTPTTGEQDKQWIAVDNSTAPGAGFGNVYMFWRNFASGGGMAFTRSLNDGVTWGPNAAAPLATGSVQGANVTVGRDHAVYVFWHDSSTTPRQLRMRKSINQGASFGPVVTVAKLNATGINGDLGLSPGFRTNSFPQALASPTNSKHLFVVYNDKTGAGGTLDRADIYLTKSLDGGATWSAPHKLNDDATKRDQWQPAMALTPDGKRICVAWYDRRLDSANNLIDRYGVIGQVTSTGSIAFGANFRITSQSFPPVFGVDPMVNGLYMGDYDQMTASNTAFGTTWGDNRDNSTGHAGKNANVRFAKVGVTGPAGGGSAPDGELMVEVPVNGIPGFAREALDRAVGDAPAGVLSGPVTWEKAFQGGDTIAIFKMEGKDKDGRAVEAETKGSRVIELEVKLAAAEVPAAVSRAVTAMNAGFQIEKAAAVVVAGKVVTYTVRGTDGAATTGAALPRRMEVNVTPEGKVEGSSHLND